MKLTYFNIQRFSLHDGPGIRTTVFLKGCPLRCVWCHNPESQSGKQELLFSADLCTACGRCLDFCGARRMEDRRIQLARDGCILCGKCVQRCPIRANELCGKSSEAADILEQVKRDIPFYEKSGGGMTVSGGEPAAQAEPVLELLRLAKESGISIAMETCGYGESRFFTEAADLGCLFLFDIKGIDPETHKNNTGVSPERIRQNLDYLVDRGADIILRLPLIPGMNDSEKDLQLLCDFLRGYRDTVRYAEIMPYHNLGISKNHRLGRACEDEIPDGKAFLPAWIHALAPSGIKLLPEME